MQKSNVVCATAKLSQRRESHKFLGIVFPQIFFLFLYCGELTQCVYCKVFLIFWSKEEVCGIHICFWPISFAHAVRLTRFVSSGVSDSQNLEVFRDRFGKRGEE